MHFTESSNAVSSINRSEKKGGKEMRKKLVLLALLLVVSVGAAFLAGASGALQILVRGGEVKINEELIFTEFTGLSSDQRAKAVEIALGDPQVQEMLDGADDYYTGVSEILDVQEIEVEEGGYKRRAMALIPKEGLALVELRIYKDYGEELGIKAVKVTVDLLEEKVKEIEEFPEVRKPKVHEGIISTDELLGNPSKYHDQRVTVSGEVSKLGEVRGPYFMLDEKIWVCYLTPEGSIDISNIKNGDYVIVTGTFWASGTIQAENIEKAE